MIIVPKNRIIENSDPISASLGIEGWYTLRAIDGSGNCRREMSFRQQGPFHNLILNNGLDLFGGLDFTGSMFRTCSVGTGSSPPDVTDTQLSSYHGWVSSNSASAGTGNSGTPDYYHWMRRSYTSAIGQLGTVILQEVGIGNGNQNGNDLFSKELIRDSAGNPTSFPLLDTEQLQVIYEARVYPPLVDATHTVAISGNTHDVTVRPLSINVTNDPGNTGESLAWGLKFSGTNSLMVNQNQVVPFTGDLGANTSTNPLGSQMQSSSAIGAEDYTTGDYYRDSSATWNVGRATGSIRTVRVPFVCGRFQFQYDPPISKEADDILRLDFRFAWGRR